MNPEERKAKNRMWRDLWAMTEQFDERGEYQASRQLREYLESKGAPRPAGRPTRGS